MSLKLFIIQQDLHFEVQQQIQREQVELPVIHEQLANLDVAIGFLVSLGKAGHENINFVKFAEDELKMDRELLPDKVRNAN